MVHNSMQLLGQIWMQINTLLLDNPQKGYYSPHIGDL
jgi:hypothetical protein